MLTESTVLKMDKSTSSISRLFTASTYILLGFCLWYLASSLLGYTLGRGHEQGAFQGLAAMRLSPPFADMKWLTVIGECGTNLQDFYKNAIRECAAYGYGTNEGGYESSRYPPMVNWLLRLLHVKATATEAIGMVTAIGFLVTFMVSVKGLFASGWSWPLLMSVMLFSFPVQLGLERGNLDVSLFVMMLATCLVISLRKRWSSMVAAVLTLLSVSLKVYPAAGFIGWLTSRSAAEGETRQSDTTIKIGVALATLGGLALSVPWLLAGGTPVGAGGLNSYGLKAIGYINLKLIDLLGIEVARWVLRGLIMVKVASLVAGIACTARLNLAASLRQSLCQQGTGVRGRFYSNYFSLMSWTWLGCYILTISYDYRLIFMLPSMAYMASLLDKKACLKPGQLWLVWTLFMAALLIILFPLAHYNGLAHYANTSRFLELFIEMVPIPFYAGSLGALLLTDSFRRHRN